MLRVQKPTASPAERSEAARSCGAGTEARALLVRETHGGLKFAVALVAERLREAYDRRRVDAHALGDFAQRGERDEFGSHQERLGEPPLLARQAFEPAPDLGERRMLPDVVLAHGGSFRRRLTIGQQPSNIGWSERILL